MATSYWQNDLMAEAWLTGIPDMLWLGILPHRDELESCDVFRSGKRGLMNEQSFIGQPIVSFKMKVRAKSYG